MKRILLMLVFLAAPVWPQTPHIPTAATLPQSVPSPTYPATIQTVKEVCAAAVGNACTSGDSDGAGPGDGLSDYQETGNGNGLASAISDMVTNRGTLCNTNACEIRIDAADFNKDTGACISRSSSYNLSSSGSHEIIIRTTASTLPAQGTRITSSDFPNMPCLESGSTNVKIFTVSLSASKFRWMGIYGRQKSGTSGGALIEITNNTADTTAEVPSGFWLDRSFLGCPITTQTCSDGIQFNAQDGGVVDSILTGFKDGGDANAIVFWNTPGNLLFDNNELSATGESLLSGGATVPNTGDQYNPTNITITRNYLYMDPALLPVSNWSFKNILELKVGNQVLIEGNVMKNSYQDGQNGQCINLKSANSGNSNYWAVTEHVTIRYNKCINAEGEFVSIQAWNSVFNSQEYTHHITVHDNLCDGCSNGIQTMNPAFGLFSPPTISTGTGAPPTDDDKKIKSIFFYNNTTIASARSHTSFRGGPTNDLNVPAGQLYCVGDYAAHNNIWPLARQGTTGTDTVWSRCKIGGVRNDAKWIDDTVGTDVGHSNFLMNAGAAATTSPFPLDTKLFGANAAGSSSDQCSNFVSCSAANIGADTNDYTQDAGVPNGVDLGSGVRNVGANIGTATTANSVIGETCGAISGTWACQGGAANPPVFTSVTPDNGSENGGTSVTIAGTDFVSGVTVTFGGTAGSCAFVSSTEITCDTPGHAAGAVDVVVTNPDLQSDTGTGAFTFNASGDPTISSITPARGTSLGGQLSVEGSTVVITGTNFAVGVVVTFGGLAANCNRDSATQLTCAPPTKSVPGAVDVVVTNPDTSAVTSTNGYTYTKPVVGAP